MTRRPLVLFALATLAAIPTLAALWLAFSGGDDPDRVIVLAPSSLAPVRDDVDAALEAQGLEAPSWVFAGSQALVAQVADGAPADVVLTADRVSFDAVRAAGVAHPAELFFAENHLVLAVADGDPGGVDELADLSDDALLVGQCAPVVPCGRLAIEALGALGVEPRLDTEETSARALTTKLSTGELDVGLIYHSDAVAAGLAIVDVPGLAAFTNTYWGTANDNGIAVLRFLASGEARAILAAAGFDLPADRRLP